jgi:hypothetical protein
LGRRQFYLCESLGIVQEVARETSNAYTLQGLSKKEQGCLPLDTPKLYMDGQTEQQISKMRYVPGKEIRSPMGDILWRAEPWLGLVVGVNGVTALQVILEKEWVLKNFSRELLTFLRDVQEKEGQHGFVFIPEGDNEGQKPGNVQYLENAPDVSFCNTSTDESTRRCVLDSAASGLRYLGLDRLA